jgi:hypothetical protein
MSTFNIGKRMKKHFVHKLIHSSVTRDYNFWLTGQFASYCVKETRLSSKFFKFQRKINIRIKVPFLILVSQIFYVHTPYIAAFPPVGGGPRHVFSMQSVPKLYSGSHPGVAK